MQTQFNGITDSQWKVMSIFFNNQRRRKYCLREICNGILWITRTGCQWRNLPPNYPPWKIVYYYFQKWGKDEIWTQMLHSFNIVERVQQGKEGTPSVLIADSQSIKLAPAIYEMRGTDGNKKVNGRKRQVFVDTNGRIWSADIHAANKHDGIGALEMLLRLKSDITIRLEKFLCDRGYRGQFAKTVEELGYEFDVPIGAKNSNGFIVIAKRWVVERTFAWFNFYRRITVDYEHTKQSAVSFMYIANISMVLQKIDYDAI